MTTPIYIILPAHNRVAVTQQVIESIRAQTEQAYHVLLIDDGSTDGTDDMARRLLAADKLTVIKGDGDWWWAGSLQQGIDWLKDHAVDDGDIVLMTNDDVIFPDDFLANASRFMANHEKTLLLSRFSNGLTGDIEETGIHADLASLHFKPAAAPGDINCLSTRGLFLRWADIKTIGRFHTTILPHYWSDYEYTLRAGKKGLRLTTTADVYLSADMATTGIRNLESKPYLALSAYLRDLFSKRTIANPLYRSSFIILACPFYNMPSLIAKTWIRTMLKIIKAARSAARLRKKRRALLAAIDDHRDQLKLIIGAGQSSLPDWVASDYPLVDITSQASLQDYFSPASIKAMLAEHVWEHLTPEQALAAAKNCHRFLQPGGRLRLAVPDGNHPDQAYIDQVKPGGSGPGSDDHKVLYTLTSLTRLLETAGFAVTPLEWFDENGQFHAEDWDPEQGMILRSTRFDPRNRTNPTTYTSLIVDAVKQP